MMWVYASSAPVDPDQTGARNGLQAFELLALLVAVFRLLQSGWHGPADAAGLALSGLVALGGHPALAVTVFAAALF